MSEQTGRVVSVYLSDEEHRMIATAAEKDGRTLSNFFKFAAIRHAATIPTQVERVGYED